MNNKKQLIVESVDTDGVCYEYGIEKGDIIVSFDGKEVVDMLDYSYYDSMDSFTMTVKRGNELFDCQIEKDETEELGLNFEDKCYLTPIPCRNKCLFCFVDQLPKGLRSSLYIKDDDYRLSFVSGNYVTLTNVSDEEINRIIERKFSPIYISVHATDDTIRMKLLGNNSAKPIMPILKKVCG
jgi:Fe-S oxidoreductase, related to NifB/MoaA family